MRSKYWGNVEAVLEEREDNRPEDCVKYPSHDFKVKSNPLSLRSPKEPILQEAADSLSVFTTGFAI